MHPPFIRTPNKNTHMNYYRFYKSSGELDCIVNMEQVQSITPKGDGTMRLHMAGHTLDVQDIQLEKALSSADRTDSMSNAVSRLIQAMDRMTVHFPTSIRMHL